MSAEASYQEVEQDEPEVIPYPRTFRYQAIPDMSFPEPPTTVIRRAGLLGLGRDGQDVSHERRTREIKYVGFEQHYAEALAVVMEVKAIKDVGEGVAKAELIACSYPADTVPGMVVGDMVGEMAARRRVHHARAMENYDAEVMNIIRRRYGGGTW